MGLAGFEVLAWGRGGNGAGGDRVVIVRHFGDGTGGEWTEGCVGSMKMGN